MPLPNHRRTRNNQIKVPQSLACIRRRCLTGTLLLWSNIFVRMKSRFQYNGGGGALTPSHDNEPHVYNRYRRLYLETMIYRLKNDLYRRWNRCKNQRNSA